MKPLKIIALLAFLGVITLPCRAQDSIPTLDPSENDTAAILEFHREAGEYWYTTQQYSKAFDHYRAAVKIANATGDSLMMAQAYFDIGYKYFYMEDARNAIEYLHLALDYAHTPEAKKIYIRTNTVLGNFQLSLGTPEQALDYYKTALAGYDEDDVSKSKAGVLNNFGLAYMNLQDSANSMRYFQMSMDIRQELKDMVGVGQVYNNIGTLNLELGRYKAALLNFQKGLELRIEHGAPYSSHGESYINVAKALHQLGKLNDALEYYQKGYKIARETAGLQLEYRATSGMQDVYYALGRYDSAFAMQTRTYMVQDSLFNLELRTDLLRQTLQHEYTAQHREDSIIAAQEKEAMRIEANEKAKTQSFVRNGLIIGFVLLLIIGVILYRSYRAKKADNELISEQRDALEESQREITDSIRYAQRIQSAILPSAKLVSTHLPDSFVLYRPKDIVSGDFYWLEPAESSVLFAAVDCTGHGVPGAMVSVIGHNALNRSVNEFGMKEPAKILDKTADLVEETFEKSESEVRDGMDLALCHLDLNARTLEYSGANNALYIVSKNQNGEAELRETKPDKQPIGRYHARKAFTNHSFTLNQGDCIYIFSDGFADQFGGPKGKKFKYKQFRELLVSMHNKPMREQHDLLLQQFEEWRGNLEQIDDVCVIGVRV